MHHLNRFKLQCAFWIDKGRELTFSRWNQNLQTWILNNCSNYRMNLVVGVGGLEFRGTLQLQKLLLDLNIEKFGVIWLRDGEEPSRKTRNECGFQCGKSCWVWHLGSCSLSFLWFGGQEEASSSPLSPPFCAAMQLLGVSPFPLPCPSSLTSVNAAGEILLPCLCWIPPRQSSCVQERKKSLWNEWFDPPFLIPLRLGWRNLVIVLSAVLFILWRGL